MNESLIVGLGWLIVGGFVIVAIGWLGDYYFNGDEMIQWEPLDFLAYFAYGAFWTMAFLVFDDSQKEQWFYYDYRVFSGFVVLAIILRFIQWRKEEERSAK